MTNRRGQNQRCPRKCLTLDEKLKVIVDINEQMPYSQISMKHGISKGQVSKLKKNRDDIASQAVSSPNLKIKKRSPVQSNTIELEVCKFLNWMRSQRIPVPCALLKERAAMVAHEQSLTSFKASNGWLQSFLWRNGIRRAIKLFGEASAVCEAMHGQSMTELRTKVAMYEPSNVYNADESGLMYCVIPSRTYISSSEVSVKVRDTRFMRAKNRITVMVCSNADGSHKVPLHFIGKSVNPQCFQDIPECHQFYSAQRNAWMDNLRFTEWLYTWYSSVRARSSGPWLLILENFCGHETFPNLSGVTFWFLPPSTMSVHQPMDQGVIKVLKNGYRTSLLREHLHWLINTSRNMNVTPTAQQLPQERAGVREGHTAHVADAIRIANQVWRDISSDMIANCWKRSTCFSAEKHQSDDTIGNVQEEIRQLLEERDLNLNQFRSVNKLAGVLNDVMNGSVADVMQALEALLHDEAREQDVINSEDVIHMYLNFDKQTRDEDLDNNEEAQRIIHKVQFAKQKIEEAKQMTRDLFGAEKTGTNVNGAFQQLQHELGETDTKQ